MRTIYYVKAYNENEKQKIKEYVHRNITDKFYWLVVNWRKNKRNEVLETISKVNQNKLCIFY